eukprot:scaffold155_cov347-Pavlova_lutheri.AAC.61
MARCVKLGVANPNPTSQVGMASPRRCLVQMPCGPRKSGMPHDVDTPALLPHASSQPSPSPSPRPWAFLVRILRARLTRCTPRRVVRRTTIVPVFRTCWTSFPRPRAPPAVPAHRPGPSDAPSDAHSSATCGRMATNEGTGRHPSTPPLERWGHQGRKRVPPPPRPRSNVVPNQGVHTRQGDGGEEKQEAKGIG